MELQRGKSSSQLQATLRFDNLMPLRDFKGQDTNLKSQPKLDFGFKH